MEAGLVHTGQRVRYLNCDIIRLHPFSSNPRRGGGLPGGGRRRPARL
jgi:hypothetical protein